MTVAFLNDTTVTNFIDTEKFEDTIMERFRNLDIDGDGVLNRDELQRGFRILPLEFEFTDPKEAVDDLYNVVFDEFDVDKSGGIDKNEFKLLMTEILLAMARGIGNFPVQVALEQDSLLMKAVEHEQGKQNI